MLKATKTVIETINSDTTNNINPLLEKVVSELKTSYAKYGPVIRLALTGSLSSPGLAEMIEVLGKKETIYRLENAIDYLSGIN